MSQHREPIDRRTFLKAGALGAVAASSGLAHGQEAAPPADAPATNYRVLGRTGLKVAVVGIGAMRTTEPAILQAAFDRGVNYIDTAACYADGKNEPMVGDALKGYRDKVFVATKLHFGPRDAMIASAEKSLQNLKTDHIDVLQLHHPTKDEMLQEEPKAALAELKKQGKVRFLGVTTHEDQVGVMDGVLNDPDKFYDMVLVTYNFKSEPAIGEAIERLAKANIGVVAMKTQSGGYDTKELGDISPHQAALKWVLRNPNVHTAVPAMVDLRQVKEDTEVMRMQLALSEVDRQILARYGDAISPYYCRMCGQCLDTCPLGVDIRAVNRCLMYSQGYGDEQLARGSFAEIPRERSAMVCRDCSVCTAKCAIGLDIASKMCQARELLV